MRVRRFAAGGLLAGALLAVLPAAPAWAHDQVPAASDYRTELVAVTPQPRGVQVRVVENGSRIEVANRTGRDVTVLGYAGEPYLRITPEAVYANTRSPATAINDSKSKIKTLPTDARVEAKAAPSWKRIGDEPIARWHDHRSHWTGSGLPPAAEAEPGSPHRLRNWTVELVADRTPVKVTGTLDYAPPPATPVWWAGMLVAAAAVVLLGRWRRYGIRAIGAALAVGAGAELLDGVGRVLDSGATGLDVLARLLTTETYGTLSALGALAAAVVALRRQPAAPFALALAGACLAVLGGVTDAAVFSQAFAPVPWSGEVARVCTAAAIAAGAGATVAGWLRARANLAVPGPAAEVSPVRG
jgi:hypothetical protein